MARARLTSRMTSSLVNFLASDPPFEQASAECTSPWLGGDKFRQDIFD
jgi:hypothetical protein